MRYVLLMMMVLGSGWLFAQNSVALGADSNSRIWFEGTSTLHDFTCEVDSFNATLSSRAATPETIFNDLDFKMTVVIPVKMIKSSKGERMDKKMYETLSADKVKTIVYEMTAVKDGPAGSEDSSGVVLETRGLLSIVGQTRPININVRGILMAGGGIRLSGAVPLDMTDFGIEPPKMMLGALRTDKKITIHFDLRMRFTGRGI